MGRLQEALEDFDAAVRLAPHFHDALVARGHTRLLLQQEAPGVADLETVLSQDPANETARNARAEYRHRRGDFERAIAEWTEAIGVDPARSGFYRNRGLLYYSQGDSDRPSVTRPRPFVSIPRTPSRGTIAGPPD